MVLKLNPGRPVKDAARAVHRVDSLQVDSLQVEKVSPETLTQLSDLPGLCVSHFAVESDGDLATLHLFCHQRTVGAVDLLRTEPGERLLLVR